ncbi:uncharacterized protein LOC110857836 [Folsomia candida]|uniref:Cadherin-4 n=1 Tax=Folsomia candida TaxID=158441 RepID=A0A226DK78_FOLCA|nr:uncharacterized protein LOC110857836 [Folsomia candida]OXA44596.1 Cadherin-4 [Folsomia candida]
MVYLPDKRKCVAFIGERCKFGMADEDDNDNGHARLKWYELAECVEGAVCNTDGICQCPDTFYEDFDANKCTLRKDFGEACGSSLECNLQKMLICGGNRTCECFNPDEMTYIRIDNESSSCKVKVGRNCIGVFDTFRQAIRNQIIASNGTNPEEQDPSLELIYSILNQFGPVCANGSYCYNATCSCPQDYYVDYEAAECIPVKRIDDRCTSDNQCNATMKLICIEGTCQCDPDKYVRNKQDFSVKGWQWYSYIVPKDICLAKVGSDCFFHQGPYSNTYSLAENAFCFQQAECDRSLLKCKCPSGFSPTRDNLCGKAYDMECSIDQPCSDEFVCSPDPSNIMKCLCPNEGLQKYEGYSGDDNVVSCRGQVGTPCEAEDMNSCVKNAACVRNEVDTTQFICKCKTGFVPSFDRQCHISHGYPCETIKYGASQCDHLAGLKCRIETVRKTNKSVTEYRQVCSCPNKADMYDLERRTCARGLGVSCNTNDDCLTNGLCRKENDKLPGNCECKKDFIQHTGRCIKFSSSTSDLLADNITDTRPGLGGNEAENPEFGLTWDDFHDKDLDKF